jgi:hypothetical protein
MECRKVLFYFILFYSHLDDIIKRIPKGCNNQNFEKFSESKFQKSALSEKTFDYNSLQPLPFWKKISSAKY